MIEPPPGAAPADLAGTGLVGAMQPPPAAPEMSEDAKAAMAIMGRLARGETLSGEEVYETLNRQDSVIIGDPETCRKKMEHYRDIGVDRLLCFQQVGALSHDAIMDSMKLVGKHLIPYFSPK
jgi:alkanesulfonate monooxygenase SsuD/methylene tetrahydromethanopterin reductase-like flavin-dependent oxidoreductase (luciferase family)